MTPSALAVSSGRSGLIESLGASSNQPVHCPETSVEEVCARLIKASSQGDSIAVNSALKRMKNFPEEIMIRAFIAALKQGYFNITDLLLNNGLNPNAFVPDGNNPLMIWTVSGQKIHPGLLCKMIESGGDVSVAGSDKSTLLHWVCGSGNDFYYGDDRPIYYSPEELNALTPLAALIISKGAPVDARDGEDRTPLIWAAANRPIEMVRLLLKEGADPNAADCRGMTPLMHLVLTGDARLETAKELMRSGARLELKNQSNHDALSMAIAVSAEKLTTLFLEKVNTQTDPSPAAPEGTDLSMTFLEAARKGDVALLEKLLGQGAQLHSTDNQGMSALHIAAVSGSLNAVQFLVCKGSGVSSCSKYQGTPLHHAASTK